MAELRASGLDLIREYIPELPEIDSEDEADLPDYKPSAICDVPELEEVIHEKFADSPASPPPTGDVPMDTTPGNPNLSGQMHASVHPNSDADIILHSVNSGPPQGRPLQVKSKGIPPEDKSDTDLSEELKHPKGPTEDKEDGEWTDEDVMPPLIDASDEESRGNDRWSLIEPEPDYAEYGLTRENLQKFNHQTQVDRIHRCITDIRMKLNIITSSQEEMRTSMNKRDEVLLKIIQTNRLVTEVNHSVGTVMDSQDSIKNILKDLYDIINCMSKYDKTDSHDFVRKMDKISKRMTQIDLGQERVKEAMTDLKTSLTSPGGQKRGYYQTEECDEPHYENKVKYQKLSSTLNVAYFDKQYGEVLENSKNREVRRGLKERFLELHEVAQKWEILAYHLEVICTENPEVEVLLDPENDAYLKREEAYLTIATVSKLYKHLKIVTKTHPNYKSFQKLISIMFQGIVECKISPAMVHTWLTHQIFWSLCEYDENREFDVLTDVILLYREFNPAAKPPHERDPGLYHHMPELYGRDHLYLNKLEMRCSDIMTRYCFCNFHADYPMKFGEAHKFLTFRKYKHLHEENLPVGDTVSQMKFHEGYINTNLMRILHEVHGLVTPYSPQIIFQEERMARLHTSFSPQEHECLKKALGLVTVNKTLDLNKAMKTLQWFKQSTCPCNQHAVRRGGQIWQLRPSITAPPDDTDSLCSSEALFQDSDDPINAEYNQNAKVMFQSPTVHDNLLNELCSTLLKEVKQANPLNSVDVAALTYWKDQMKKDADSMLSHLQAKLYTGLDEICGEMKNLFQEKEDEVASDVQDVPRMTNPDSPATEEKLTEL